MRPEPQRDCNPGPTIRAVARTIVALLVPLVLGGRAAAAEKAAPNILWLSSEDHGPHLGCYGDKYATTPHVDRLATRGMIWVWLLFDDLKIVCWKGVTPANDCQNR